MRFRLLLFGAVVCLCLAQVMVAQDPVKVDPKHYSVISENNEVRILKVHYGAHEKSVMHSHPDSVAVFTSDSTGTFHMPDGTSQAMSGKAGTALFTPAGTHNPEAGDKPIDVVLVELKGKSAAGAKMAAPAKPAAKK